MLMKTLFIQLHTKNNELAASNENLNLLGQGWLLFIMVAFHLQLSISFFPLE